MKQTLLMAAACLSLFAAEGAQAADKATGWKNWADHAERIIGPAEADDIGAATAACDGATRTIISQGFQFPYWGQQLPLFCNVYKQENRKRLVTINSWKRECNELDRIKGNLAKASPIAEEPRAEPLARRMVAALEALKVRECSHKPKKVKGW